MKQHPGCDLVSHNGPPEIPPPLVIVLCRRSAGAGKRYASPTAFTVAVKRQAAPAGRQGNDGWRSVLYEGGPLERVRKAYAAQFAPAADDIDEVMRHIVPTYSALTLQLHAVRHREANPTSYRQSRPCVCGLRHVTRLA